jgi:hypothetical protein
LSRRWNLVEPFVVMTVLLVALWAVAYPFGVLGGVAWANTAARTLAGLLLLYILFAGPWLHRDTAASRGLGNPRRQLNAGLLLFIVVLTVLVYRECPVVLRFLLRVPRDATLQFRETLAGKIVVLAVSATLAWVWIMGVVRYDNFWPALRTGMKIVAFMLPPILLIALLTDGADVWMRFHAAELAVGALAYTFWGAFQQLIFCSYFATRLRKGIGPATDPHRQRWRRLGVAALSGLFFGLIHINSWWLVAVTWLLGAVLAWVFMEDRNRNVFALGVVHGVLGTCRGWLFGRDSHFYITARVGPWNMPATLDVVTLVVAGLVVTGFVTFILLTLRRPDNSM